MLIEHQHPHNRSITVSVLGVPNVGKSTLINYLMGMDLTAVSSRAQTTRNKIKCVFNVDRTEIILIDTPGLHRTNKEFNKRINEQAREGAENADLNFLLLDLSQEIFRQLEEFKESLRAELGRCWVVFTKVDKVGAISNEVLEEIIARAKTLIPSIEKYFVVSAVSGDNIHLLTGAICDVAPESPHYYRDGEVSNKNERFFATEYIREQAFNLLRDELPYELAVVIDEYTDYRERGEQNKLTAYISASILVNRPSQRAIVIGAKGQMIKMIGTGARAKIEALVGGQVHLNLHVKVRPNWFKNNMLLEELGLPRAIDSSRVWRQREKA